MPDQNYEQIRYGNKDGEIRFGYIDTLQNNHSFLVRSGDSPQHFFSMISSIGDAKTRSFLNNGTYIKAPGAFQVDAGLNVANELPGVFIDANNGELVLKSSSNVRIEGKNITLIATGGGDDGSIVIEAPEKLRLIGKQGVTIDSGVGIKIVSERKVEMIADGILEIFGGLIEFADGRSCNSKGKRSKIAPGKDPSGKIGSEFETKMAARGLE